MCLRIMIRGLAVWLIELVFIAAIAAVTYPAVIV